MKKLSVSFIFTLFLFNTYSAVAPAGAEFRFRANKAIKRMYNEPNSMFIVAPLIMQGRKDYWI